MTPSPNDIRPCDVLVLHVPHGRCVRPGTHRATVASVKPRKEATYSICAVVYSTTFYGRLRVTITYHPKFVGHCFLGRDMFPVEYIHEPNIEQRLADSIVLAKENRK
jgi:hypothetical protein